MEKIALCLASFLHVNLDDSNVEMGVKSPEKQICGCNHISFKKTWSLEVGLVADI